MTAPNHKVAESWVQHCQGKPKGKLLTNGYVRTDFHDGRIYSFGSHFEMGRPLRDKRGKLVGFLLNGDTYSSTTTGHQSTVRSAVNATNLPVLIVPYSALRAAGIDRDTVQIVEALPDRYTAEQVTTRERQSGWWEHEDGTLRGFTGRHYDERIHVNDDGSFTYTRWTHRLGEALFLGTMSDTTTVRCDCEYGRHPKRFPVPPECPRCGANVRWDANDARYRTRATGRVTVYGTRTAQFLSGWDHNEPRPLYFLSEMPNRKSRTVAEAYEELKPTTVKMAEQMGRAVRRQGDIFAVPVETLDKRALRKMGAEFGRMAPILTTNHVATEVAYLPDGRTLARGVLWHKPRGRVADHRRVKLADGQWHLTVKNTVPLSA